MIANGVSRQFLLFAASALFASGTAFACGGPTCPCDTLQQAIAELSAIEAQEAGDPADLAHLQVLSDREFMREAISGSAANVSLARLALEKSQNADLKQFVKTLIRDQMELRQQVLLAVLSGAQFDGEFIKTMLKDQKQDLKRFGDETQLAGDPGVQVAALYGKKLISDHLDALQRLAGSQSLVAENQTATIGAKP
jgi:predicted outer membrane protein